MTTLTPTESTLLDLDQLQVLSQRYARYNRSAGGLASVLGGVLCLLMFFTALLTDLSQPARLVLTALPVLWLACKELLRRFYYQRAGAALDVLSITEHRLHIGLTAFVALVSLVILASGFWRYGATGFLALPLAKLGYFAFVLVLPLVTWRWLWSSSDFIVGVGMFCQSALIVAGSHYSLDFLGFYLIGAGLFSLLLGIKEHRDYLQLNEALQQHLRKQTCQP